MEQVTVKLAREFLACNRADVRRDEAALQEAGNHRGMVICEKDPDGMRAPLKNELVIVHHPLSFNISYDCTVRWVV